MIERVIRDWVRWFNLAADTIEAANQERGRPGSPPLPSATLTSTSLASTSLKSTSLPAPSLGDATPQTANGQHGAASSNDAEVSADIENMIFKPSPTTPSLRDIALEPAVIDPIVATIRMPYILPNTFKPGRLLGILLYGPRGCGKSLAITAAAKEYDLTLLILDISSVFSNWQGDSEK